MKKTVRRLAVRVLARIYVQNTEAAGGSVRKGHRPATLLKKRLWHQCFPVNFKKTFKSTFFIEHLWWLLLYMFEVYFRVNCVLMKKTKQVIRNPLGEWLIELETLLERPKIVVIAAVRYVFIMSKLFSVAFVN